MPTIYTITIPDDGSDGTLLVKKGELAHLMQLSGTSREDILFTMLAAQTEIEVLEANPPQISEAPPEKKKASKPKRKKKRKASLNDIPEDDSPPQIPKVSLKATQPNTLAVGQRVEIAEGATDVDGDALEFYEGNICEIDEATAWVESLDGEYDVWLNVAHLTPITGNPRKLNKSTNQLTLFN